MNYFIYFYLLYFLNTIKHTNIIFFNIFFLFLLFYETQHGRYNIMLDTKECVIEVCIGTPPQIGPMGMTRLGQIKVFEWQNFKVIGRVH